MMSFQGVVLALLLGMSVSCQKRTADFITIKELPKKYLDNKAGNHTIEITASGAWEIKIYTQNSDTEVDWVWFEDWTDKEGRLSFSSEDVPGGAPILLQYAANHSTDAGRKCQIIATCGTASVKFDLDQAKADSLEATPDEPVSDKLPVWMELPATDNQDNFYVNHEMKLGARNFRNYSLYMSKSDLVAHWVAYPLNPWTISSGVSRTNDWNLDPKIPRGCQPVLFSAFGGGKSSVYARGHQIPSADRYAEGANQQTFYGSNMTPQMHSFNSGVWASLEGAVRNWCRQFDSLYVVTGCYTKGSVETAPDNDGKDIVIPVGYYKVLLGFNKAGKTGKPGTYCECPDYPEYKGTYTGIAFYLNHSTEYVGKGTSAVINASRMTIDDLEKKVGVDFYQNLPVIAGEGNAANIEKANDTFWAL